MENTFKKGLIEEAKKKKELLALPDESIQEVAEEVLKKYPSLLHPSPQQKKLLIKDIRAKLRRSTGMFQLSSKKRLSNAKPEELLKNHVSTAERLASYPLLKEKIHSLHARSILDIGCGLNPLALASQGIAYAACDIRQDEIQLMNAFFKEKGIAGRAFVYNVRNYHEDLPEADLCLLWKVLEIVGGDTHALAQRLVSTLRCRYLLVSFSTRTLSGKRMQHKRRRWFERILKGRALPYETFEIPNEMFYLIKKC